MTRLTFLALAVTLVAAGLVLRLGPWHPPLWLHHFGGSFLWGAMVFAFIGLARPPSWGPLGCLVAALAVIVVVECLRLVHTPWLDAFRTTLAGQLLLGRIFSAWNILVDALGAATVAVVTAVVGQRPLPRSR